LSIYRLCMYNSYMIYIIRNPILLPLGIPRSIFSGIFFYVNNTSFFFLWHFFLFHI
jgi:hypothetical protein